MLVDLARNDANRVCDPLTTRVDRLMVCDVGAQHATRFADISDNSTVFARSAHHLRGIRSAEA